MLINSELVDIEAGWAVITGEVDRDNYALWIATLHLLEKSPKEEVTIVYSSEGGDCDFALAIFDALKAFQKRVRILVNGPCQSAATLIIQAAAVRECTKHSSFMIHYGQMAGESDSETKFNLAVHDTWCRLFAERTGMSLKKSRAIHAVETFLTAEQAHKLGVVDRIIE